jgi:hypothetical protein
MSRPPKNESFVPDPASMLAVYVPGKDGRNTVCVGFIMPRARQGVEAFNADTKSLGLFKTQAEAADALTRGRGVP